MQQQYFQQEGGATAKSSASAVSAPSQLSGLGAASTPPGLACLSQQQVRLPRLLAVAAPTSQPSQGLSALLSTSQGRLWLLRGAAAWRTGWNILPRSGCTSRPCLPTANGVGVRQDISPWPPTSPLDLALTHAGVPPGHAAGAQRRHGIPHAGWRRAWRHHVPPARHAGHCKRRQLTCSGSLHALAEARQGGLQQAAGRHHHGQAPRAALRACMLLLLTTLALVGAGEGAAVIRWRVRAPPGWQRGVLQRQHCTRWATAAAQRASACRESACSATALARAAAGAIHSSSACEHTRECRSIC